MRRSAAALACALASGACSADVLLPVAVDHAPASAIVLELRGAHPRYRALEPVPPAIDVASDAEVHVLLYDDPLALLGVDVVDGELSPFDGAVDRTVSPVLQVAVSLPAPARWASGGAGADALVDEDPSELGVRLGALKFRRPACPEYVEEAAVSLPSAEAPLDFEQFGADRLLVLSRGALWAVSTATVVAVELPDPAFVRRASGLVRSGDDEVLIRTDRGSGTDEVWVRLSTDGTAVAVDAPLGYSNYALSSGAVDGRWRFMLFDGTHVVEADPVGSTARARIDVGDASCVARLWVMPQGDAVGSRDRSVFSLPLDVDGPIVDLIDTTATECLRSIVRTPAREVLVFAESDNSPESSIRWRAPGEPWRVVPVDVPLALPLAHDGELIAVTLSGLGVARVGPNPQLCPVGPPEQAAVVAVGGRLAAVPTRASAREGEIIWLRPR